MLNSKILLIIVLLLLINISATAQVSINGKVTNESGQPLSFANVFLKETKLGAVADEKGEFTIVSKNLKQSILDTLVISYVGYKSHKSEVYLAKNKNVNLKIELSYATVNLKKVSINASDFLTPLEILEKVKNNIKINYSRQKVQANGFYRELIKENNTYIELNEATFNLDYDKYPQKRFFKKGFRQYYKDGFYSRALSDVFKHIVNFPYYVSKKDQLEITNSRTTFNNSHYGINASPIGGPLDLIALDRVKYLYDFLDPKMFDSYVYNLKGVERINGIKCYVLSFKPDKHKSLRVFQRYDKKMQFALYTGLMYITVDEFSVIKILTQLSQAPDFSLYNTHPFIPDFVKSEVNYTKLKNGKLMISSVFVEQRKSLKIKDKVISYTCFRDLELNSFKLENFKELDDNNLFPITQLASLKYNIGSYNNSFWRGYVDSSFYIPIEETVLNDLEKTTSLEEQFKSVNIPIDSIEEPAITSKYYIPKAEDSTLSFDSYLLSYLKGENAYAEKVLSKLRNTKKQFVYRYSTFYPMDTIKKLSEERVKSKWEMDSIGHISLYELRDDSFIPIFNYTKAAAHKTNFNIEDISFNSNKLIAYTYSTEGSITNYLIVKEKGKDFTLDSIANVKEFVWLNDSTILYTKTNEALRSFQLKKHIIFNKPESDSILYEEKNEQFDLVLSITKSKRFITLKRESLNESSIFLVDKHKTEVELIPFNKTIKNHSVDVFHLKGDTIYYLVQNLSESFLGLLPTTTNSINFEDNNTILYKSEFPIHHLAITDDYLVFDEYKTNGFFLNILNLKSGKKEYFKYSNKPSQYYLEVSAENYSNNVVQIEIETPTTPFQKLRLDIDNGKIDTVEIDIPKKYNPRNFDYKLTYCTLGNSIKIPISILENSNLKARQYKGLIIKTYAAYGALKYPDFNEEDLIYSQDSILVAYVHARGGGELGKNWYYEGKLLNKKNSFSDFVSATQYIQNKYGVSPKNTIGYATSAGGLVLGYVANNYPNLYGLLVFDRPYLDVVNTMSNSNLPLTTLEYLEWGNPVDSTYGNYIESYSPFQNIGPNDFPNMLFFANAKDNQTPVWQIANTVARFRKNSTSNNMIMLLTDFSSGHRGSINLSSTIEDKAIQYSIINYFLRSD